MSFFSLVKWEKNINAKKNKKLLQEIHFSIQSIRFPHWRKFIFREEIMTFSIAADPRNSSISAAHTRKEKKVPAVVYGKTQEPISIVLDASDFLRLYRSAGESSIIDLKVGKLDSMEVLIHQTQKHPVTGEFTHVDFYAITRGEKLSTKIALEFVGEAPAAKEGMIIQELVKELEVHCLPRYLVDHFEVDLSILVAEGDTIRFSDLKLDSGKYDYHYENDLVIASATMPRAAVEEVEGEDSVEEAESSDEGTETKED